ncbi:polysaccharide deacetylase family protein [Methylomagnum sp.]
MNLKSWMTGAASHAANAVVLFFAKKPGGACQNDGLHEVDSSSRPPVNQTREFVFILSFLVCLAVGVIPATPTHAAPAETMPELMLKKPAGKKLIRHDRKRGASVSLKLRRNAAKFFSRLIVTPTKVRASARKQLRTRAFAGISAIPPELLNASFSAAATPPILAHYWVGGDDCIDASWGTYTRVSQTDGNGNTNFVMQLAGGSDSAYGCQIHTLNQDAARPLFIGGWVKGQDIAARNGATDYGAYIGAYFVLQDGDVVECYNALPNTGTFPWRWVGFNTYSDCGITQPIVLVAVTPRLVNSNGAAFVDNMQIVDKELVSGTPAGQVTVVFDDGFDSDYSTAYPILNAHNIPATSAVISDNVGAYPGVMTYEQAYTLLKAGWDIQSHSVTHQNFTQLSAPAANTELANSQIAIRNGLATAAASHGETLNAVTQANHFFWPYSALDAKTVGWAQDYYQSGRTVYGGLNGYGAYPWVPYSWSMDSLTQLVDIQTWLNDACLNKRWLVLTAHRIGDPIPGEDNLYVNSAAYLSNVAQMISNEIASCPTPFHAVNYSTGMSNFAVRSTEKPTVP